MALVQIQTPEQRDPLVRAMMLQQMISAPAAQLAQALGQNRERQAFGQLLAGKEGPGLGALTREGAPGLDPNLAGPSLALTQGKMAEPGMLHTGGTITPAMAQQFTSAGGNPAALAGLMPKQPTAFTGVAAPGETVFQGGREIASIPAAPEKPLSTLGKIAADLGLDLDDPAGFARAVETMQATQPAGTTIKVPPQFPPAPAGWHYQGDFGSGAVQLVRTPGGPADVEAQEKAAAQAAQQQQQKISSDIVQDAGRRALELSESGIATGLPGQVMGQIGGTAATDLRELTNTIISNVAFDKLAQMRAQSPTGSTGLGPMSEQEWERQINPLLGSLSTSQSKEQFQYNLRQLLNTAADMVHGPGAGPQRYDLEGGGQQSQLAPEAPRFGDIEDGFRFLGGDPANPSSWEPIR